MSRWLQTLHAGSSLSDFSTLKMEAICSFERSGHTRSTRRHIPEDGIPHSLCCENLKSYRDIRVSPPTLFSVVGFILTTYSDNFSAYFPCFKKSKSKLMRSPSCLYVCVSAPHQFSNGRTKLCEAGYVCQGARAHLDGVINNNSLPLVCVSVFVSPLSLLQPG
jgi:hypothetical protein